MFLSIVVPCYNEEQNVNLVYCNIKDNIPKYLSEYEIIFVDDGSTDRTAQNVEKIISSDSKVRIVSSSNNLGYGAALRKGFSEAAGDHIAYMDGDNQYDFKDFACLKEAMDAEDAVLVGGVRAHRADFTYRKLISYIGRKIVFLIFRVDILDIDCGFKFFRKSLLDNIKLEAQSGLIFSLELYLKTKKNKRLFVQREVSHFIRKHGKSKGINFTQYRLALVDICKGKLF